MHKLYQDICTICTKKNDLEHIVAHLDRSLAGFKSVRFHCMEIFKRSHYGTLLSCQYKSFKKCYAKFYKPSKKMFKM